MAKKADASVEILDNYTGTAADLSGGPDIAQEPEEHVTDGEPCWCGEATVTEGGFEILPDEEESRPAPPARGKYPKLLQSLLAKGLAPGKPVMSIRVPEGDEPLLVAEGLKREGRRVGQGGFVVFRDHGRDSPWYIEAWVHPTKDRVVQVRTLRSSIGPGGGQSRWRSGRTCTDRRSPTSQGKCRNAVGREISPGCR